MSSNTEEKTEHKTEQKTEHATKRQIVAILDAGAQYGKLIDRRVRELNVESVLIPFDTPADELKQYAAIIISGGPSSVYAADAPSFDASLFKLNIPIFAICYGFQLMIHVFNGCIERGHEREDGEFTINIENKSALFSEIDSDQISVLLTHGDIVSSMPHNSGFEVIATSTNGIIAAAESKSLNIYGVQFHPEVDLTPDGRQMFNTFLFNICGLTPNYTLKNRMFSAINYIRKKVGKHKKVLCLVSGGVDSSVCCALLQKAIAKERIYPVHIDHGFMRYNESSQVISALEAIGINNVHLCKADDYFLNGTTLIDGKESAKLCETLSPEEKRKIIGDIFMKLCDSIVSANKDLEFDEMLLVQGTLRPDLIESASLIANKGGTASVIKTHHNDTELVRRLRASGKVVEPLTDYHKDEVRIIGETLGLPQELVWRQPFPGPGLAIRIICSNGTAYRTAHDDAIVAQLNEYYPTADTGISCCLLGFQTVGVQGDGRSYAHCVGLTIAATANQNANTQQIPWKQLYLMAKNIPRQILNVNRCIFIYGQALCGKQRNVTATYLKANIVQQLRKCDKIVNDKLFKYNLIRKLSQVPVILFPNNFGCNQANARSVCIRTFITNDFMTGVPAKVGKDIKEAIVLEMFEEILKVDGIQRVAFDLTPKPPGTTEWE